MEYTSKAYAMLPRGVKKHFRNVVKYLNPRREDKILEIGCARGVVTKTVQDIAPETWGVDINPEAIKNGVTRNLAVMSADNLVFPAESFDKIYSFHTIEHVPNIQKMFKEMHRVLKPGGEILLVYPAEPIQGMFSMFAACVIFKNPLRAREIHVHQLFPWKIKRLAKEAGLEYIESPFSFDSFMYGPEFLTVLRK